jgi:hypothetical protein
MTVVYEEIVDFIAAGTTPDMIISFQPSDETKQRVAELIRREKAEGLSPDESAELKCYLDLEHLLRLVKARARKHRADGSA